MNPQMSDVFTPEEIEAWNVQQWIPNTSIMNRLAQNRLAQRVWVYSPTVGTNAYRFDKVDILKLSINRVEINLRHHEASSTVRVINDILPWGRLSFNNNVPYFYFLSCRVKVDKSIVLTTPTEFIKDYVNANLEYGSQLEIYYVSGFSGFTAELDGLTMRLQRVNELPATANEFKLRAALGN